MYLWPEDSIVDDAFSNGYCAQTEWIADQRYAVMEIPETGLYVSILTYLLEANNFCKAINDRTVAVVDVMEVQGMEAKMVTVDAKEMAQSIARDGSVALYGIYFDSGKADVKPESVETLEQIAKFLANTSMQVLVVGHTDNVGSFESNMDLSKRRAEAVVKALTSAYEVDAARLMAVGVSFAAPVATNATEEGRAKNRRVELVGN
jgi:outer membrane protein OmpA-like peptidoglycan-associated protein